MKNIVTAIAFLLGAVLLGGYGVICHAYHSVGKLSLRMFSASGGDLGAAPPPEVTAFKAKVVIF